MPITSALETIHSALSTKIKTMTVAGGYFYTWSTVDAYNSQTYPNVMINIEETGLDQAFNYAYTSRLDIAFDISMVASTFVNGSNISAKKYAIYNAIEDFKRCFGAEYSAGSITSPLMYNGTQIIDTVDGDQYGCRAKVKFVCTYEQDRNNPNNTF